MQHQKLDDGPRFPCSQCGEKFTMSDDLHSHTNSVHLKINPLTPLQQVSHTFHIQELTEATSPPQDVRFSSVRTVVCQAST